MSLCCGGYFFLWVRCGTSGKNPSPFDDEKLQAQMETYELN
ncbi:MAG TPA: hypothetical protein VHA78_04545 [Candidatus Peribacteraceae bacterium]|nr:hypothetical protein [Candidatus Peribacteraceae bacterium]